MWKEIYLVYRILKTDYMTHTYIILVGEVMSQAQSEGTHFLKGDYITSFSLSIAHLSSFPPTRFPSQNGKTISCDKL